MAKLLLEAVKCNIVSGFAKKILESFPDMKFNEVKAFDSTLQEEPLSNRERDILILISEGLTNKAIADRLYISLSTVKWHTSNIYGKLEVQNRTEAVAKAKALKIL